MGSVRAFHTSLTPIPFYANNDIIAIILFRIGFDSSPVNIKNITVFFSPYGIYKLQCKGIAVPLKLLFKVKKETHY